MWLVADGVHVERVADDERRTTDNQPLMNEDTIVALSSGAGRAALAVVRLSGPGAVAIVDACFQGSELAEQESHTAHVGWICNAGGERIDQVVATLFLAPRSATGETVVEVSCHGGAAVHQEIQSVLVEAGARPARPGEFTQRAFLNGKLDLAQAEAVADLIHAESKLGRRVATAHLEGRASEKLAEIRTELIDLLALVELELDFSDEDVEFANREKLHRQIEQASEHVEGLLNTARLGSLVRNGATVVIGGRPNAGKSTLLNALVERDRAIVSQTPGTTRDSIEAEREIDGLLVRFVDTAGLRDTKDAIEAEGVRRSEAAIEHADALVYVIDAALGLDEGEEAFLQRLRGERPRFPVLVVNNKVDRIASAGSNGLALSATEAIRDPDTLEPLKQSLLDALDVALPEEGAAPVAVNERHRHHLSRAREALNRARAQLNAGASGDILSLDLRTALDEIGAVTGEVTSDDVLGAIFSRFCIGK